jgi:small subunit ribosomal protein S13
MFLFDVKLPTTKPIKYSLNCIYGLNNSSSISILKKTGFSKNLKIINLNQDQIYYLIKIINSSSLKLSNNLKKINYSIFKKFIKIKCFKGFRFLNKLPLNGQRTHTNARTARKLNIVL